MTSPTPIFGDALVIKGPVDPGGGVAFRARLLERAIEAARGVLLGLVEHQVLEEVGEPGLADLFVTRAHGKPGVVAHHGGARVDARQNREPVAESVAMHEHGRTERDAPFVLEPSTRRQALVELAQDRVAPVARALPPFGCRHCLRQSVLRGSDLWRRGTELTRLSPVGRTRVHRGAPFALLPQTYRLVLSGGPGSTRSSRRRATTPGAHERQTSQTER